MLLNLSYLYRIVRRDIIRIKIIKFEGRDLLSIDDTFFEKWEESVKIPWAPRISTQPPSLDFCSVWPVKRGIRANSWVLIGEVNARAVRKLFKKGVLYNVEVFWGVRDIKVPRMIPMNPAVRA